MLSCRWMADKHGELWFLTHTDRLKPRTTSSACKVQVRAKTLGPYKTRALLFFCFCGEDHSFDLSTTRPELTRFGRAPHQTERRLCVQGGLLNRYHAACCAFIEGNIIIDD